MSRALLIAIAATCFAAGCSQEQQPQATEHHNQLESANERNTDLNKLLKEREEQLAALREEHKADILELKEFHAAQLADLETKNADLQMQLGLSEKQRLALKGVAEQPDRLKAIAAANSSIERSVWMVVCAACLGTSLWVGLRYFTLRARRRDDLIRVMAKLGHRL